MAGPQAQAHDQAQEPSGKCEIRPGTRFGAPRDEYEVDEEIGSGAAARVFACRRLRTGEVRAVKVIDLRRMRLGDFEGHLAKLDRECQILRKLRHDRIVGLLDVFQTEDFGFLVMERIWGGELFDKIVKSRRFSEEEARHVFRQLLEGIGYMHSQNVIHRDIKPENILIVSSEAAGAGSPAMLHTVKIGDFGLSKIISEGMSVAKTFVGTPQYWAPEVLSVQTGGPPYGNAADFWGLGAVLFVMLSGRYPFDGKQVPLEQQIRTAAFNMSTAKWRSVSDEAKDLVRGLLRVDASERFGLAQCLQHPWVTGSAELSPAWTPCMPPAERPDCHLMPLPESMEDAALGARKESDPVSESLSKAKTASAVTVTDDAPCDSLQGQLECQRPRRYWMATLALLCCVVLWQCWRSIDTGGAYVDFGRRQGVWKPERMWPQDFDALDRGTSPTLCSSDPSACEAPSKEQHLTDRSSQQVPQHMGQLPWIQQALQHANDDCAEKETIFRLNELLRLQVSIAGSLEMACLALRHADLGLADATHQVYRQARDLFEHAAGTVSRYAEVAGQVSHVVLPDLLLAVQESEPALAVSLLEMVKAWVANMSRDGEETRQRYRQLQQSIEGLVQRARSTKLGADQRLAESVLSSDSAQSAELVRSHLNHLAAEGGQLAQIASPPAGGDGLGRQARICTPKAKGADDEAWRQSALELLFMAPGIASQSLPALTPFDFSASSPSPSQGEHDDEWMTVEDGEGDDEHEGGGKAEEGRAELAEQRPVVKFTPREKSDPGAAAQSSMALLKALKELRRVDSILQGCSSFWANMDTTVEKLSQMKEHTEALVKSASNSQKLKDRFEQRLKEYTTFWTSLEQLCRQYCKDHQSASTRMQDFMRQVTDATDLVDTTESVRRGVVMRAGKQNPGRDIVEL